MSKVYRIVLNVDGEREESTVTANSEDEAIKDALDNATLGNITTPEIVTVISAEEIG